MNFICVLLSAAALFLSLPAKADGDLASFGVGYYDINDDEDAVDFRLEYRWDIPALKIVRPWAGVEASSDGAFYGVGGVLADIRLSSNTYLTPGIGAGLYADGGGKDLGHDVIFRTQLELGYEFDNASRASIAVSHLSNASLSSKNPGTEVLGLYYHVPADSLFRR